MRAAPALLVALVCLLVAPAADAKDDVVARLTDPLVNAPSGGVHINFALRNNQSGRPFSALGVVVHVQTRDGQRVELNAEELGFGSGQYTAWARTRSEEIVDLEVGLAGVSSGPGGTQRSDAMFPIANDPYPGPPATSDTARTDDGRDWTRLASALVLLLATVSFVAYAARRRLKFAPLLRRVQD
jgi:hypothetical protein